MLKGHIQVATDLFFFPHSDQKLFINLRGKTIEKTNPVQPFNLNQVTQQLGKPVGHAQVRPVPGGLLRDEHDFFDTDPGQESGFIEY